MNNVKYLLKFGEKAHLEEFVKGSLYCSNAKTFWGIEDKLKLKDRVIFLKPVPECLHSVC